MAQQTIGIGAAANDGTGDNLRAAGGKINANFTELYAAVAASGASWKSPVRVATTVTGTLATAYENGDTVDGVVLATGDRILIKNQSTGAENGIYVVAASGAPARAADADAGSELVNAAVLVSEGTANADTLWVCTTNATITLGSTTLTFTQFNTSGTTFASTTEQLTGTEAAKASTPDSVAALWEQGADVASAGATSLAEGGYFNITGTTTITDIDFATDKAGRTAWVKFAGILTLTHNASTLILPTGANITTAAGDTACFVSEGSDIVRCVAYQRASGAPLVPGGGLTDGNLINVQTITATGAGTYTPTAGTASIVIELLGAGGGGGGVANPTGSNVCFGQGGGGGAYIMKRLTANFSGAAYSVGAKGTGGAAGANNGNAGGNTTFTDTAGSPTTYTAGGGSGGATEGATGIPAVSSLVGGGAPTNGDVKFAGGASLRGIALSTSRVMGALGGGTYFTPTGASQQALSAANASVAGISVDNTTQKGCGGGGALSVGTGGTKAGGDGADGMIIIWEYS